MIKLFPGFQTFVCLNAIFAYSSISRISFIVFFNSSFNVLAFTAAASAGDSATSTGDFGEKKTREYTKTQSKRRKTQETRELGKTRKKEREVAFIFPLKKKITYITCVFKLLRHSGIYLNTWEHFSVDSSNTVNVL